MLIASGAVWCFVLAGRIPRQFSNRPPVVLAQSVNYPALGIVLVLTTFSLIAAFSNIGQSPDPASISAGDLQSLVGRNLLLLAMVFGLCFLTEDVTPKDYGIDLAEWPRQLAVGGLAFLASWLPVFLLLLATSAIRSEETMHPFLKVLKEDQSGQTLLWISLAVILAAPLWEEFAYRVILQTSLCRWLPLVFAIGLTACLFSAVHGWPDMIPLLPLALVLGGVYHHYRSYLAVVTAHALFNGAMLAMALVDTSAS